MLALINEGAHILARIRALRERTARTGNRQPLLERLVSSGAGTFDRTD
ncbi:hypothetical protein [Cupriavidus necator]|nr:hypothetical protein [Cupriavidus necator]